MIRNQSIYIGPTYKGLIQHQVFYNGIPESVYRLLQEIGPVQRLLIPVHLLPTIRKKMSMAGTQEYNAYQTMQAGKAHINDEGVKHVMSSSYFDTPVPTKHINSDGQIVNPADSYDPEDGAQKVKIKASALDVTLQNAASAAGNGTPFAPQDGNYTLTFEITGTSTSRTVMFELAGPSGQYMPVTAFSVTDPTKFGQQTTGGSNTAPESWQVEVPAGYSFRARISAVAGGNVSIKGKAVG
ncbi:MULTISPECIES: hypothetical protein [Paenibacillus]|uniref:hypothetical protein n=1 Tax=Paenibacillus TaxID=44249 RepID=UPI00048C533F|nr:hypothetical protein [Paenibacillus sp. IHBB 10380]